MTAPHPLHAARRRYLTVSFLCRLPVGLTIAPLVLLLTERGVTLTGAAGLVAAYSVQSLAPQLTGAAAGLLAGALPVGPPPWLLAGAILPAGALLRSGRNEPTPTAAPATRTSNA
ncbi:hypothetical protein OHV05_06675 [Kitasatospora sp. NBC_00070]|uniref:hypothetical protein n=1 Tax=Kitasatospora sp. NBC_00070 TaxID=2975962 RepID=UPI00324FEFFE